MGVGTIEPILLSNNSRIGELQSQLASNSSGSDMAASELESTERHLDFEEDAGHLKFKVRGFNFVRQTRHVLLLRRHGRVHSPSFRCLLRRSRLYKVKWFSYPARRRT